MCRFAYVATVAAGVALSAFVGCGDEGVDAGPVGSPPTFTEFPDLSLAGVDYCSLAWGDMDNDGNLDLAVAGTTSALVSSSVAKVYENDGAGGLSELPGLGLPGVFGCALAWGDADNDGDLDLAVAGDKISGRITTVYENAGGAVPFTGTELAAGLMGVSGCSLAWGDCDNDGDLDLAVAGSDGSTPITTVYENVGGAVPFSGAQLATGLTGVRSCSLAWGDADNDGDLDLAVAGNTNSAYISKIYENVGGAIPFDGTELAAGLTGVHAASLAWGDCDNDGDLDLAIAGWTDSGPIARVYRNEGAGTFTELPGLSLTGVSACSLVWGDADNDGDLDLAVAGWTGSVRITTVYENNGADGFVEFPGPSLMGIHSGSLAWGDVDNDGDLDLAVAGDTGASTRVTTVYENDGPLPNAPPDQVTGLSAFSAGGEAVLMWSEGSDAETPAGGLSYNLRVVDTGSGLDVFPAMADANGRRRVAAMGPIRPQSSYAWHVLSLPPGDYEFQVQAIDSALEGGPWSEPEPFTVPTP